MTKVSISGGVERDTRRERWSDERLGSGTTLPVVRWIYTPWTGERTDLHSYP